MMENYRSFCRLTSYRKSFIKLVIKYYMNNTTVKVFPQDVATIKFSTANDLHYMVQTADTT